ncbi:N-acetylneuraminate lyase-like isoform X2 [Athalia rosae]|uniref:N-acetylneuraminate lyase-like isoform X2 n=1 Tax=Athalia rosae TaxID=37344 RepID=UPI002034A28B|nr:N-acetylneuraminate lyase-like isoform X2 [Athalia rosae]
MTVKKNPTSFIFSTRSLNLSFIPQYAKYLADRGITGVLVNGTSGEGPLLNVEERKAIAEAWVRASKATNLHLMLQIGGAPLPDVIELAKHGESIGVDSLLTLPELYFKPTTPEQLIAYLEDIGEAAPKTPLLYYNYPLASGVNINMAQFVQSIGDRLPTFVGMKFTSTNLEEAMHVVHTNNKEFALFLGNDQLMAGAFTLGIDSVMATTLNMYPDLAIDMLEATKAGEVQKARELQEKLTKFVVAVSKYGSWVATMKVAMALLTEFDCGPPRAPLTPLPKASVSSMKADLRALGCKLLE